MLHSEKTLVGIPFYETESEKCLDITLNNVDQSLNELDIDASIIVQINGPKTAMGQEPKIKVDKSKYNSEVSLINSNHLGQTRAINELMKMAQIRGIEKIFVTDADIYRFPETFKEMWSQSDKPVTGAFYRPYPIEVVEAELGSLSLEERLLYQVFDGDQSPQVRKILAKHGLDKRMWVKASLMLLEVNKTLGMHDNQYIVTDSVMNRTLGMESTKIAKNAFFMHMGRMDMNDHIKARLRHFIGAKHRNDLENFLIKEKQLPDDNKINQIAAEVRDSFDDGDYYAMLYLARCAVRSVVNEVCLSIIQGTWDEGNLPVLNPIGLDKVKYYSDAKSAVTRFLQEINWTDIQNINNDSPSTTQEKYRDPIDLRKHLIEENLATLIFNSLGISRNTHLLNSVASDTTLIFS